MKIRIAILCNDRLCLPALSWLLGSRIAVAVAMPEMRSNGNETRLLVQQQCMHSGVPFSTFSRGAFTTELNQWLQEHRPDLVLVMTFPWLIPSGFLERPALGFINFHYAPLPAWRGPSPLFWMIRNQVKEGAVTVHRMDESFDTGPILLQQPVPIQPHHTYGWLVTQLAYAGLQACWSLLQGLASGTLQPVPQEAGEGGWYARPQPADLVVDWERMPAASIRSLVLACNPWNKGAATSWNNWAFGLTDVSIAGSNGAVHTQIPGTVLHADEKNGLIVSCLHDQLLRIDLVYCEEGFFPGHKLSLFGIRPGHRLGSYTMPLHSLPRPSSALYPST